MPTIPDSYIFESQVVRNVQTDEQLESTLQRGTTIDVELVSTLSRTVSNDEPEVEPEVTREYNSFMSKAAMNKVQYDVLNQNLSTNPYFDQFLDDLDNTALRTRNQTIIKAINELYTKQSQSFQTVYNSMMKFNRVIGDLTIDNELKTAYRKLGAKNVLTALVTLNDGVNAITDFVKGSEEDMAAWNELGYTSLVNQLTEVGTELNRVVPLWNNLTDAQLAEIFSAETTQYDEQIEQLQNDLTALGQTLTQNLQDTETRLHNEIVTSRNDIINLIGKWGTLEDSELEVMLQALGLEKTETSSGVTVVHNIVDKYSNLVAAFDQVEADIQAAIGSMGAWGNMTQENAELLLNALGIHKDNPTGVDVMEQLIAMYAITLDEIDGFRTTVDELNSTVADNNTVVHQVQQDLNNFESYINERFQILSNEVYGLLGAWGQLSTETVASLISLLGDTPGENPTGIELITTLSNKYVALNQKMDDFAATMSDQVSGLVDQFMDPKMAALTDEISASFTEYKAEIDEQIRYILSALAGAEQGEEVYETLKAYLETEIAKINSQVDDINNRVSSVEIIADAIEAVAEKAAEITGKIDEEFDSIHALLTALQEDLNSTKESYNNRISRLEELADESSIEVNEKLDKLDHDISTANEKIDQIASTVDTINTDIGSINNQITDINSALGELENDIADRFGSIENTINGIDSKVESLKSEHQADISNINNRVTTLEALADITYTVEDECSEEDIRAIFEKE